MPSSPMAELVGRVLGGRYRIVAPIGSGASARVYLAEDVALHRRVAVKLLHPGLAGDVAFLRRLEAEARAAAALSHPHIMRVFDSGSDGGDPFLVLEHLDGGSLRDLLDAGHRLTPAQAARVGAEAARALDHAHRRGLVHRDVKPANLLFDADGRACIADFGLARALAEAAWTEPSGALLGTARYAAPEQARPGPIDGRADVYALALVLVEAVTGQVPFAADTTVGTLMARVDRDLEVPAELGPLADALAEAGRSDPDARIDAAALATAMEAAARALPAPGPLPLAPPDLGDAAAAGRDVHELDRTQLGEVTRPAAAAAGGRLYDRLSDPLSDTVDVDATAALEADLPHAGDPPPERRRRGLRRAMLGLLAVLVLAGGAAGALAASGAFRPEADVPSLRGKAAEEARRLVEEAGFRWSVIRREHADETEVDEVLDQDPAAGKLKEGEVIRVVLSKGPPPVDVPDIAGRAAADVIPDLEAVGLRGVVVGDQFDDQVPEGVVIHWAPQDDPLPKGSTVEMVVSKGPAPRPVPEGLIQQAFDAVKRRIEETLFAKVNRVEEFSDTVEAGKVIRLSPAPGTPVERGATVTVVVSKGPELVSVPDVRGQSCLDASDEVAAAGLAVETTGDARRTALGTDPAAGTKVKKGSKVTISCGRSRGDD